MNYKPQATGHKPLTTWTPDAAPMPREHGAWVILYGPMLVGLAAVGTLRFAPAVLVVLAVTGAYLARHAAALLLRRRGNAGTRFWLGAYALTLAVGAVPLIGLYRRYDLLVIGGMVGVIFGAHAVLMTWRGRLDRSLWGELLAVSALTLTAPAAVVAENGSLDGLAWRLWAICILYFSSSIFYVKMLLSAGKARSGLDSGVRWRLSRPCVLYHLLLAGIVGWISWRLGGVAGGLAVAGYLPVVVRALRGAAALSTKLPSLKRVGVGETLYAIWFAACLIAALRLNIPT